MTGPPIFGPANSVESNPIFNPNQDVATGMPNIPGRFAGAASALSQLVQLQQAQKDQAIGQLARIHAAIDNNMMPQSVMETPEVQDLFHKAGLDAMAHQAILPKPSDTITQQKQAELDTPIFSEVGSPGSRSVTGLPQQGALNVSGQEAADTQNPNVARQIGKIPQPLVADIQAGTAVKAAKNESTETDIGGEKLKLVSKAVEDGEKLYTKDKQFHAFVVDVHAGVLQPYVEALKQSVASLGLEKQAQGNAAQLLGQAITSAPTDFQNEHKDWLDQQSKESNAFRQTFQLSNLDDDEIASKVADHMAKWNFDHKEPTLEGIVSRNWSVNAKVLGMTPQQASDLLKTTIHIESPGQQRLHTTTGGANRVAVIGSIIEQAKHDPQHITFDPGDGKGTITVSLSQLYGPKSLLTKPEIDYLRQTLNGDNPKFNPASGSGQGGGSHRPVNPVAPPTQVP